MTLASFRPELKSSFIRDVGKLGGGAVLAQLVLVASSPILSRLYSPSDFGVLAQFTAILGIVSSIGCARYEAAIPLANDDAEGASVAAVGIIVLGSVIALICLVLSLFGAHLTPRIAPQAPRLCAWLLPLALFGTSSYQIATYWAIRTKSYASVAGTKIYQAAVTSVVPMCLAAVPAIGPVGLLLGATLGSGVGALRLARVSKLLNWLTRDRFRWASLKRNAAHHARTATASSLSGTMNLAASQAPLLLMTAYFGPVKTGFLFLAMRLISATDVLIGNAVGQVFFGEAAASFREDPARLRSLFIKTVVALAIPSAVISAGIWLLAPFAVTLVFGKAWSEAGFYAHWLALRFLASMVCSPVSTVAFILGKQLQQVVWEVVRTVGAVLAFWWCAAVGSGPRTAVMIYAMISFGAYAVWLLLLSRYVAKAAQSDNRQILSLGNASTVGLLEHT